MQNGEQIPDSFEYFWLLDGSFNKIRYLAIMRRTTMVGSFKIFEWTTFLWEMLNKFLTYHFICEILLNIPAFSNN